MTELRKYNVTFKGYRLERDADGLPEYSGVYLAYRCRYNSNTNAVMLIELIYIGQAENIQKRIIEHRNTKDLHNGCGANEVLCYAYASVSLNDLDVVENALVYAQQPRLNTQLKDTYNHQPSSFVIEGTCSLLKHTDFKIS